MILAISSVYCVVTRFRYYIQCGQVFRAYRESYEQQKISMEQRFRGLLEESLEDAIFLSAVNSHLKLQMQDLKQGMSLIITLW